jgi:RNA polymerase sigma factor (sigma-70 family)
MLTEDGHIIHKCINGEPEAFGFIVDKYKESIYAFAYTKLGNFHDAEDVTQEVLIKAFRKLNTLKSYDSLPAWLYAITSNLCKDFLRSKSKRPDQDFIEDNDPNILDRDSANTYREDLIIELLHDALDTLPEIYRQVLVLHYLGNMNSSEIADFTGIAQSSVRTRLTRARELLKKEMLEMMASTYDEKRLRAGFTFNIVEMVKKIRINPIPTAKGLPYGLSLATGLIFVILSFGSHIQINLPDIAMGLPLPSDMKILKVGEIPVDAVKVSTISSIGNKDDGKGLAPDPKGQENAFFMAPQGEGKWTAREDMPTARGGLCTVVVNGKIYVIGGFDPIQRIACFSTVEEYDPVKDTWKKKSDMPTARFWLSVCAVGTKIYAMGGMNKPGSALTTVEIYDTLTDTWTKGVDMQIPRCAFSASVVGGKIYSIGGLSVNNILSAVEEFDTGFISKSVDPSGKLPKTWGTIKAK